jgi:hypothetical protein
MSSLVNSPTLNSETFVTWLERFDYVPFVSSITAIALLALKPFAEEALLTDEEGSMDPYRFHNLVYQKSLFRLFVLMVPGFGNVVVAVKDLLSYCITRLTPETKPDDIESQLTETPVSPRRKPPVEGDKSPTTQVNDLFAAHNPAVTLKKRSPLFSEGDQVNEEGLNQFIALLPKMEPLTTHIWKAKQGYSIAIQLTASLKTKRFQTEKEYEYLLIPVESDEEEARLQVLKLCFPTISATLTSPGQPIDLPAKINQLKQVADDNNYPIYYHKVKCGMEFPPPPKENEKKRTSSSVPTSPVQRAIISRKMSFSHEASPKLDLSLLEEQTAKAKRAVSYLQGRGEVRRLTAKLRALIGTEASASATLKITNADVVKIIQTISDEISLLDFYNKILKIKDIVKKIPNESGLNLVISYWDEAINEITDGIYSEINESPKNNVLKRKSGGGLLDFSFDNSEQETSALEVSSDGQTAEAASSDSPQKNFYRNQVHETRELLTQIEEKWNLSVQRAWEMKVRNCMEQQVVKVKELGLQGDEVLKLINSLDHRRRISHLLNGLMKLQGFLKGQQAAISQLQTIGYEMLQTITNGSYAESLLHGTKAAEDLINKYDEYLDGTSRRL